MELSIAPVCVDAAGKVCATWQPVCAWELRSATASDVRIDDRLFSFPSPRQEV